MAQLESDNTVMTVEVVATTDGEVPKVCRQFPAIVNMATNKVGERAKVDGEPEDFIYEAKKYNSNGSNGAGS